MKALNVSMINLKPMTFDEAKSEGYSVNWVKEKVGNDGYLILDSYMGSYWLPKSKTEENYFILTDDSKIVKEDVEKFITKVDSIKIGEKTTVVNAHTLTGFDIIKSSSCVDPKNYSDELGKKYAMENVIDNLWEYLGFVLQWAKNKLIK